MANVTFTATAVQRDSGSAGVAAAGEAIAAGDAIFIDKDDNLMYKADASSATKPASVDELGVALVGGALGQTIPYSRGKGAEINFGASTFVKGQIYVVSPTAGKIMPAADLATTDYSVRLGYASSTAILVLDTAITGVQIT